LIMHNNFDWKFYVSLFSGKAVSMSELRSIFEWNRIRTEVFCRNLPQKYEEDDDCTVWP